MMAAPSIPNGQKIENQENLDKAAKNFEKQIQTIFRINFQFKNRKDGPNKQKNKLVDLSRKDQITGLYSHQSHRAIQEILLGSTIYCPIDTNKIEKHYVSLLSTEPKYNFDDLPQHLWKKNVPSSKANSLLVKDFTSQQVKSKLLNKIYNPLDSSRSIGLDKITFKHLRSFDRDCSQMTYLFNMCLKLQTVPKVWMEFYSVLIKIKDMNINHCDTDDNDIDNDNLDQNSDYRIKNWRTVTMHRTISKLFQSLIAARLIAWAKSTDRLSTTQKGILVYDAACESSFILQQCKNYAEEKGKGLVIAWLDFTNASDFIAQPAVLNALNKHLVPSSIIKIIQNMLEFSTTKIRVMGEAPFTKSMKIKKGLPQGSPINPILLDLVIEPILTDLLTTVTDGFEIYNEKINHYAIPNELTLIADSPSKLQNLLNSVEKNAKLAGLNFKIHKCSTYHYDGVNKEVKLDNKFLFFGQKLNSLSTDKIDEYFGVKQGLSIGQESLPSIQEMIKSIEDIDNSLLEWYQKVESTLIYVIPRVENYLRGIENTNIEHLAKAEQVLKDKFKSWLNLPVGATTASIVYQVAATTQSIKEDTKKPMKRDVQKPVYNYLPFMDLFHIMKIVQALKILTSQDQIVKKIAFVTLTAEVDSLIPDKKKIIVTKQHLAQYLSGELHIKAIKSKSMWHMVREATLKLKIRVPLTWQYQNGIKLIIRSEDNKRNPNILFNGKHPSTTEEKLKNTLVEYYINEIMTNKPVAVPQKSIRKKIENQDDLDKEAEDFENQTQVLCKLGKLQIKAKKKGPNKQQVVDLNNKHQIRGLYDHQSHRAVQEILFGPTIYCPINPAKIEKYFSKKLSTKKKCNFVDLPKSLWQKSAPSTLANSLLIKNFTPKEVKSKLSSKIYNPTYFTRSTGLDRISFKNLRYADPEYSEMIYLFNACLKLQTVPERWMEYYSVLVKAKDKDLDNSDTDDTDTDDDLDIRNWRTITMQRTVSKLFQSLIAARLIIWAKITGRLSTTQKGFLMQDAACESSFILQQCKNYAQEKGKDLAVAWLDFTEASNFIPQSVVLNALSKHSVPSSIVKIVQNMLEFSNTKIRVSGDEPFTKIIKILEGLPQGSPMNPILLDLVIEPVLKDLWNATSANSFELHKKKINHYAIPNELILIADSPSKLQNLLNMVEKDAKMIGLKFNIHICSTYHYDGKAKEIKLDSNLKFFGTKLSVLPEEKVKEYFGVKQGLSIGQEGSPSIQEMIDSIEAIDKSLLDSFQKIESTLIYIIPRAENYLRGMETVDAKYLAVAEQVLKDKFKNWLNLPVGATTSSIVYQVAATKQSIKEDTKKLVQNTKKSMQKDTTKLIQYNYLPFMDLFYIMKVVHALKMLTSQDEIVKTVALTTLTAEVNNLIPDKKKKINVTKQHLAQYLSGELNIKAMTSESLWYTVRNATLKLKVKIPLSWQYKNGMQLVIKCENNKTKNNTLLSGRNPCTAEEKMKKALVEYYINEVLTNNPSPDDNLKQNLI